MPIYEYSCAACGHAFEKWQKMSDPQVRTCPKCKKKKVEKLISQTAFQLKGGGWYADLYSSSKPGGKDASTESKGDSGNANSGESKGADSGATVGKQDSKHDGKQDSKQDTRQDTKQGSKQDSKQDSKQHSKADTKDAKKRDSPKKSEARAA